MKAVKILAIVALCSFAAVAGLAFVKKQKMQKVVAAQEMVAKPKTPPKAPFKATAPLKALTPLKPKVATCPAPESAVPPKDSTAVAIDRIPQLFALDGNKLPIVETITYSSHVPWLEGKPAWVSDYASHYATSRHFIARSLNRSRDYFSQKVREGDRFNVLRSDKNISFHLVVSVGQNRMLFYYYDADSKERVLLKSYPVGLGRPSADQLSGCLTPLGTYELGDRIAIYKPGDKGLFQQKETEMIRVFGTRWIPFDKGYGIHGVPWTEGEKGILLENRSVVGRYDSDGCIRLLTDDIEELFAIVVTKPTTLYVVKNFADARLPGKEVAP